MPKRTPAANNKTRARFGEPGSDGAIMDVKVEKLGRPELASKGVFGWPVWTKEVSRFDWKYDSVEECYFLEGKVTLTAKGGRAVSFGKGDFVTFPKGLECTWDVKEPVRKHYNFK
jgi:uncharacterized cupin superfamily protein